MKQPVLAAQLRAHGLRAPLKLATQACGITLPVQT